MFLKIKKENIGNDIIAGIIVALVSIPISMGYSQIAGLPVIYGLYGSLFPVLIYGLLTSSPQFVFGVDATPAALVGGMLATMGIATGTPEAMKLVPVITLVVAAWLFIFYILKAGRLVNYISTPVMGGFISGIGVTIILMQVSKLFGGNAGTGELIELVSHIWGQLGAFNAFSAVLGFGTVAVILVAKKYIPKFPMSVVLMVLSAVATAVFHIDQYGVKLLPHVDRAMPKFAVPEMSLLADNLQEIIVLGLTIAVIIRAVVPPKSFLGVIPGHEGFYNLKRNRNARPIQNTVMYRFSGSLFFANINTFQEDIENALTPETKQVIIDASGIGSVDVTAADRLVIMNRSLHNKGIRFYLTEHVGTLNDQLRALGAGSLIEEGAVRRTISLALRDAKVERPYPLVGMEPSLLNENVEDNERLAEFEWAFGEDADEMMDKLTFEVAENIAHTDMKQEGAIQKAENQVSWGRIGLFDEDEILDRREEHIKHLEQSNPELAAHLKELYHHDTKKS